MRRPESRYAESIAAITARYPCVGRKTAQAEDGAALIIKYEANLLVAQYRPGSAATRAYLGPVLITVCGIGSSDTQLNSFELVETEKLCRPKIF